MSTNGKHEGGNRGETPTSRAGKLLEFAPDLKRRAEIARAKERERTALLDHFRQAVADGTYRRDSLEIADRIIDCGVLWDREKH